MSILVNSKCSLPKANKMMLGANKGIKSGLSQHNQQLATRDSIRFSGHAQKIIKLGNPFNAISFSKTIR